jgi:hypothetical protein
VYTPNFRKLHHAIWSKHADMKSILRPKTSNQQTSQEKKQLYFHMEWVGWIGHFDYSRKNRFPDYLMNELTSTTQSNQIKVQHVYHDNTINLLTRNLSRDERERIVIDSYIANEEYIVNKVLSLANNCINKTNTKHITPWKWISEYTMKDYFNSLPNTYQWPSNDDHIDDVSSTDTHTSYQDEHDETDDSIISSHQSLAANAKNMHEITQWKQSSWINKSHDNDHDILQNDNDLSRDFFDQIR